MNDINIDINSTNTAYNRPNMTVGTVIQGKWAISIVKFSLIGERDK